MKKILITGGAGFIGSNLTKFLLKKKHQVICLDNFYTSSKKNILPFLGNENYSFVKHNIIKKINLDVDQIYNLACPASPIHYQKDPVETLNVNVIGTYNLLELSKKINCTILQASTSEVYGDPKISPQLESYWGNVNPIGIRSCYDEGKRCAETLFFDYHRQFNVPIKVARIFNTYGPNMAINDGRVVSNFIIQCIKNEDITIYGKGNHIRSFCYVDDLVIGLYKLMNSKKKITGPINLGNPNEISIIKLAKIIKDLTGSKSKIINRKLPSDDPKTRKPDINLAYEKLKWKPNVALLDGLNKTINYFENVIRS